MRTDVARTIACLLEAGIRGSGWPVACPLQPPAHGDGSYSQRCSAYLRGRSRTRGAGQDPRPTRSPIRPDVQVCPVSKNVFTFTEHDGGTRATYVSTYESAEALQQVLDMGVVEGATLSINQIDNLLAS